MLRVRKSRVTGANSSTRTRVLQEEAQRHKVWVENINAISSCNDPLEFHHVQSSAWNWWISPVNGQTLTWPCATKQLKNIMVIITRGVVWVLACPSFRLRESLLKGRAAWALWSWNGHCQTEQIHGGTNFVFWLLQGCAGELSVKRGSLASTWLS